MGRRGIEGKSSRFIVFPFAWPGSFNRVVVLLMIQALGVDGFRGEGFVDEIHKFRFDVLSVSTMERSSKQSSVANMDKPFEEFKRFV